MWILRVLKWLVSFIAALGIAVVTTHPKEMESNVAAHLEYFGVGSWGEGFTADTDEWITVGVIALVFIAVALWVCPYFRRGDEKAIRSNPGNGWRVARQMMRALTMRRVRALFMDFEAVETSEKAHELEVLAAYGLRWWRVDTEDSGWELASMEEQALSRGLGGREPFFETYQRLDKGFPEPWWIWLWRKLSQRITPKRVNEHLARIIHAWRPI